MSVAVTGTGILVQRAPFGTTTYVTIGELTSATPGGLMRNKIETSNHNEGAESYVLGILRQKDPTFHINYVGSSADHASILSDIAGNIKSAWRYLYPSGVKRFGNAYVQNFEFDQVGVDGLQGATITLAWAGAVTEQSS